MRVAAVTMVYNEPVWARVWARHYSRQVGAEHCLILDHGSTDGSTHGLDVAVERLPRTPLDEDVRASVVSDCVRTLLRQYDVVIHSDADELLVADPSLHSDLRDYASAVEARAVTAVGLDLVHLPASEDKLDPALPVGGQRRWVRFSAAMCKPALVTEPVRWAPGFHDCDSERVIGTLFLVHLRYADLEAGLKRLARTRRQSFTSPETNLHQRVPDAVFEQMVRAIAELPKVEGSLAPDGGLVAPWLARMREGWKRHDLQLSLSGDVLWGLNEAFRAAL